KDRAVDFYDLKGDIEALLAPRVARFVASEHPAMHPGRCARIELDGVVIGHAGELHPKWRQAYELAHAPMLFELDAAALTARTLPSLTPVQRHQSVWRDLSLIAGEAVTHDALTQAVAAAPPAALIRSTRLFDIYKPSQPSGDMKAGERSLSIRLELLDDEVTLTDERIDAAVSDVLAMLTQRLGVRLRA
ncbi:MAG TPA: phenylalanine--tRNA ligase subunit beta, partial [Burkholderiaceae bacterium]